MRSSRACEDPQCDYPPSWMMPSVGSATSSRSRRAAAATSNRWAPTLRQGPPPAWHVRARVSAGCTSECVSHAAASDAATPRAAVMHAPTSRHRAIQSFGRSKQERHGAGAIRTRHTSRPPAWAHTHSHPRSRLSKRQIRRRNALAGRRRLGSPTTNKAAESWRWPWTRCTSASAARTRSRPSSTTSLHAARAMVGSTASSPAPTSRA